MHRSLKQCPVCSEPLVITRLACDKCGTEITGRFYGCELCGLSDEERRFVLLFLKLHGNFREMEKALGISYPTVKLRLNRLLGRLGLSDDQVVSRSSLSREERMKILDKVLGSEITVDEALERLKGGE